MTENQENKKQIPLSTLLAKPDKTLLTHMLETGDMMQLLLKKSIYSCDLSFFSQCFDQPEETTLHFLCYLAALHDIGKTHPIFQQRIRGREIFQDKFRHEYETKLFFEKYWFEKNCNERGNVYYFADILALHHQKYQKNNVLLPIAEEKEIYDTETRLHDILLEKYQPVFPDIIKNADVCGYLITGLLIFSDWIASSNGIFQADTLETDVLSFFEKAHIQNTSIPSITDYSRIWPHIRTPSPMQKAVRELTKHIRHFRC